MPYFTKIFKNCNFFNNLIEFHVHYIRIKTVNEKLNYRLHILLFKRNNQGK